MMSNKLVFCFCFIFLDIIVSSDYDPKEMINYLNIAIENCRLERSRLAMNGIMLSDETRKKESFDYINRANCLLQYRDSHFKKEHTIDCSDSAIMLDYNKAIEMYPSFDTYEARGKFFKIQGKLEEAIADYSSAIDKGSNSEIKRLSLLKERYELYFVKKDYRKAKNDFQEIIKIDCNVLLRQGNKKFKEIAKFFEEEIIARNEIEAMFTILFGEKTDLKKDKEKIINWLPKNTDNSKKISEIFVERRNRKLLSIFGIGIGVSLGSSILFKKMIKNKVLSNLLFLAFGGFGASTSYYFLRPIERVIKNMTGKNMTVDTLKVLIENS